MIIDRKRQIVRNLQMRMEACKSWNDDDFETSIEHFNSWSTPKDQTIKTRTRSFLFLNQLVWNKDLSIYWAYYSQSSWLRFEYYYWTEQCSQNQSLFKKYWIRYNWTNQNCNRLKQEQMNWTKQMKKQKTDCWMSIDCRFQNQKLKKWLMNSEHLENWMQIETHKKCQKSKQQMNTKDSKNLQQHID